MVWVRLCTVTKVEKMNIESSHLSNQDRKPVSQTLFTPDYKTV